jgi:imidazolonepropionase-like amidohydrolase
MKTSYRVVLWAILALWPALLQAQEEKELAPVSRVYAITNVTVVQAPGRKVDGGTVVIRNGLIQAVGKGIAIPPEATVLKGDSLYVYAGFIDGLSRIGVDKSKDENRDRPKDPGNPPADRAGITPQVDVRNYISPTDRAIEDFRNVGFTAAQVVPFGGMLPGSGAIVLLGGKSMDDRVIASKSGLYSEFTFAERMYPATLLGFMSKWRDLYRQAAQEKSYETLYAANRSGLERPVTDRVSEAFYPVIDKQMPVLFKTETALEVHRALTLQKDLGFNLTLGGIKQGWDVTDKLKAAKVKPFLSLELPEDKKKDEKSKEEPKGMTTAERDALEKRKKESIQLYTGQAAAFQKAGLPFGFSTLGVKPGDVQANLRRIIAAGLTEDQALAALTTAPAQLLGLSDRLGTIDPGKVANLVISRKPYFDSKAKVRHVFVDGVLYTIEQKEEKKPAAGQAISADALGGWSYTAETPQQVTQGTITLNRSNDAFSGTITGTVPDKTYELKDIVLEGNNLSFYYTVEYAGEVIKIEVSVKIDGKTFEGTMIAGKFGSFPIKGNKTP